LWDSNLYIPLQIQYKITFQNYRKVKKEFGTNISIPIKGLTQGEHSFVYLLDQCFFDQFGSQDIREAQIEAGLKLEKQSSWIRMDVALKGAVVRSCDRCLGDITIPVTYNAPLMVKFAKMVGEEESDEIIILDPTASEVDLTQYLYDSVCISLPLQSLHPAGQCDPEMEQKISELTINK